MAIEATHSRRVAATPAQKRYFVVCAVTNITFLDLSLYFLKVMPSCHLFKNNHIEKYEFSHVIVNHYEKILFIVLKILLITKLIMTCWYLLRGGFL